MKPLRSFGILGGMGPASTLRFLEILIGLFRDRRNALSNSDFPRVVMYSMPEANHLSERTSDDLGEKIHRAFATFQVANVDFVVAPCNTVHQYFTDEKSLGLPLLPIVNALLNAVMPEMHGSSVLLLATRQTKKAALYASVFNKCHLIFKELSEDDQIVLDEIIIKINAGDNIYQNRAELMKIIETYGADLNILGCTELSLLLPLPSVAPIIDSLRTLAEATYRVAVGERRVDDYHE